MAKAEGESSFLWETIKTIFWALIIAGVFRSVFFQPFWIPSGSMKDTLLVGDFLFVNKMSYGYSYASCPNIRIQRFGIDLDAKDLCGFLDNDNTRLFGSEPERGDVAVFRHPVSGEDYIKRVIGLPGDRIQMIDSVLHINGEAVEMEPAGTFVEPYGPQGPQGRMPRCFNDATVGLGGTCEKERFLETLPNGVTHSVLNVGYSSRADDTAVFTVPEGEYFMMGDNRDNSTDSRFSQAGGGVGFVPYENLIGRANRVIFSSAGRSLLFFWDWRGDRFLEPIE
ncbi:Signal peptidase I [Pseudooceanicola marinus]|uniref:Signal peptidase I n=1 Tax=Pseudooceanicola marinus TaxID=396013 RepID=A0A1X6ZUE1_9RHOB|nr:signal peptidase I [Pseudooceanicola marinus]MBY5972534.1 signal peptidase I [Ferrimonas balearica]MCA1335679.1 signal peptidase I [Pseudooceanicola marinus]PJE30601.1 signal peptidase I [Pseudooceanicola marinus]SLN61290.1 Signal peptidase I [Pseudooceanicola marinus]